MGSKIAVEPTEHGITLAETKEYLKVEHDADDITIRTLIEAAREHIEKLTWRALTPRTIMLYLSAWDSRILLPEPPLKEITGINYIDVDGNIQTLASGDYLVDDTAVPAVLMPGYGKSWPAVRNVPNAIEITYICGYETLPSSLKTAMLLLVAHWYEHRAAVEEGGNYAPLPIAVDALVDGYRVVRFQ